MKWLSWRERKKDRDRELDEEIQADFALEIQQRLEAGATREEAEFGARRDFGNISRVKEVAREMWGWSSLERLGHDSRYAFGCLRKAPAFTITAVLTLALGIRATTAIFTLVYAVMLKSLAGANPANYTGVGKKLVAVTRAGTVKIKSSPLLVRLYKHFRDNTKSFRFAAFQAGEEYLGVRRSGNSEPAQSYRGEFVSGNIRYVRHKSICRTIFTAQDDRPDAQPVVGNELPVWQQKYESDLSVIGSVFDIDDRPITVIGITPQVFSGDASARPPPDFFLPLATRTV